MAVGALSISLLNSCDLETAPTDSMSGSSLMTNAGAALVPLNGIYRSMYLAGWSTSGSNSHQCFGISAYNLMAEVMGDDMIMNDMGNGWFWFDADYSVKPLYDRRGFRSYDLWNAYYTWISNANYILAAESTMQGETNDVNYVIGQAYAIRAYSYFMLAQSFARTYVGHESEPCCPIYTEPTTPETEGKARATVQDVYAQITADMDKAVSLLKGTHRKHISHISYPVACGIQARIALTMEDWKKAKDSAAEAIQASGSKIIPINEFMGVNTVVDDNQIPTPNVMWGAKIIADQSGSYAGFFTHMDPEAAYGGSARKQINKELYAKISATDSRTAWWNPSDPANKKNGYQQTKFKFTDLKNFLGDYVWMRVEEMYLIAAEASCRLGDEPSAKSYLNDLMEQRDSQYDCSRLSGTALGATTYEWTGSLLEEIILQRRIELWGEAGRIYDIRRLKQGFVRKQEQGWPAALCLSGRNSNDPESYMWVLTIPQSEFDGNANMNPDTDQNPVDDTK